MGTFFNRVINSENLSRINSGYKPHEPTGLIDQLFYIFIACSVAVYMSVKMSIGRWFDSDRP
jgi:hypothetical protein